MRVLGRSGLRDATGAAVVVTPRDSDDWALVRTIRRNSGFNSSQPNHLRVGLGDREGPSPWR
ncbi:MAG: hypothetical protein GY898_27235 [Proteobacteria bacterium]|nr:hypothetical protein [Pseudomonadota bacterium]